MVFPASLGSGLPKQSLGQLRSAVQTVLERVHSEPSTGAWRSPLSLVGTEDALLQQLADSMLKEDCASELRVHLARSLPLPSSVDRPRIDLIVFVVNLHSKYSLRNVEESLHHVDATFFLGKAAFLATGAGRESHCSVHRNTIVKLAHTYRSPLFFCDLEDAEAWGTREVPALPDFPHNIPQKPKTSRGEATRSVIQLLCSPRSASGAPRCSLSTRMSQAWSLPSQNPVRQRLLPPAARPSSHGVDVKDVQRPGGLAWEDAVPSYRRLSGHHGTAPGTHAADLRWPRARCLSPEPAVPAEEL
ncbi:centromere protein M isoform X2 [Prionailurus viverrinus]|uniref:centromere protein M isoform X2 n=1 Tax=Prionailurus viverrinus TaxID=61388 RepID=UPI001FF21F20|nr:centromere protein M isoform X2 [Prionailurus viverrinus]